MIGINLEVLRNKNAQLIFASQLVSTVCDKMMSIGLIWYLTKTFSITVVPWYLAGCFLPHVLMAFYSTPIINNFGAFKTVVLSEFFRGLVLLLLFFGISFFHWDGRLLLQALFVAGFFVGLGSSLFNPAILSLPPKLVESEKIAGLNALIDSSLSISTILGATVAVFLLNFVDLKTLILINAVSFFWAGILQLNLVEIKSLPDSLESTELIIPLGPLMVVKKYPEIARMLFSFLILNLFFTPLLVMIPWYVEKKYFGDSSSLAIIEGSMGLGAFLIGILMSISSFKTSDEKRVSMISSVAFLFGLLFFIFAFSSATWQGALLLFSIGVLSTFLNIQVITYFQMSLKVEEIPAIMTAVNIISAASVPLSLGFSGLLFPIVDMPSFAKISGLIIVLIAQVMPKFLRGSLWKLE
jgi:MFS family permease